MPGDRQSPEDVEIVASVKADELRFSADPDVRVSFPGAGKRQSGQATTRENITSPVQTGQQYRRVSVTTRIGNVLVGPDHPSGPPR
jgi:hypothetical protein